MKITSIDIGTNTVLLLIADVDANGIIHPLEHEQRLPRLGKDVDQRKIISTSAFDRISWILNEYKNVAKQRRADKLVAAATSAVRDAANREEFLSYLYSTTGIQVDVLSGDEEALWTYKGVMSGFSGLTKPAVVLDIGGGSTEISFPNPRDHNGKTRLQRYSFQLGSVRLTERYFKHSPPLPAEIENTQVVMLEEFSQVRNPGFGDYHLIGVAGTATTLACIDQNLQEFDIQKVSGYRISRETVAQWMMKLSLMDSKSIQALSTTTEGRADILTAGVLILHEFMRHFGFHSIIMSERGLRYGLIIREWEKDNKA